MRFAPTEIEGSWVIDIEPIVDHRGFFARSWCRDEFADHGLVTDWAQSNLQFSPEAGTMRGLHYQLPPYEEIKLVRCTQGSVFDVAVDIRPGSPTYMQWSGVELRAEDHRSIWVPKGCAHGYVTLEVETEVFYMTSQEYVPEAVGAVRHDDAAFEIDWPRSIDAVAADHGDWPFYGPEEAEKWGKPIPGLETRGHSDEKGGSQ